MSPPRIVVAVLAAGASRRLRRPKQLVPIGGEPLLRRQCRCALAAGVGEVVAVLGCNADQHIRVISDLPVAVRVNGRWAEGLASSLRCAVRVATLRDAALLVLPCDQYRIVPMDIRALYDTWRRTPERACVSRHGQYVGPPVIIPVPYHQHILGLHGDVGARSVLYRPDRLLPIELTNPRATFDLDSAEDARRLGAWNKGR